MYDIIINYEKIDSMAAEILRDIEELIIFKNVKQSIVKQKFLQKNNGDIREQCFIQSQLELNEYIKIDRDNISVTKKGKEVLYYGHSISIDKINLGKSILGDTKQIYFSHLWIFIGKEESFFEISCPKFYDIICDFLPQPPMNFAKYTAEKQKDTSVAFDSLRYDYLLYLFCLLDDKKIDIFVDELTNNINKKMYNNKNNNDKMIGTTAFLTTYAANKLAKNVTETTDEKNVVFIVHGHDTNLRTQVELFLSNLGFESIVLCKEPDGGNTIIEKLEENINKACFGIVLYTADDEGRVKGSDDLLPRARQNVVFEHGWLCGKLTRKKVVALLEKGVEIPGDLGGLVYKPTDTDWRLAVVKDMQNAGLKADANKIK